MEKDRSHVTREILNLTLEIIYLLTGEDYVPLRKSDVHMTKRTGQYVSGEYIKSHSPVVDPPSTPLKLRRNNILDIINKITELLTGEVPLRCQDVTVHFSMEEWEYLEGHKDLYKDSIIENELLPKIEELNWNKNDEIEGRTLALLSPSLNNNKTVTPSLRHFRRQISRKCRLKWLRKTKARPVIDERSLTLNFGSSMKTMTTAAVCGVYATVPAPIPSSCKIEHKDINACAQAQLTSKQFKLESFSDTSAGLLAPNGFTPTEHTKAKLQAVVREPFESYLTSHPTDIYVPIDCPQYTTNIVKEEPVSCNEDELIASLSKANLCISANNTQSESNCIKEGSDLFLVRPNDRDVDSEQNSSGYIKIESDLYKQSSKTMDYLQNPCTTTRPKQWVDGTPSARKCVTTNLARQCTTIETSQKHINTAFCSQKGYTTVGHMVKCPNTDQMHMNNIQEDAFFNKESCGVYTSVEHSQAQFGLVQSCLNNHVTKKSKKLSISNRREYNPKYCAKMAPSIHKKSLSPQTNYTCSVCEKTFTSSFGLVRHQTVHNGNKVACPQCGKLFFYKSSLLIHQRIHTGEKLFGCSICGKCFTNNSNLIVHQRIHTGEKPFSCMVCGKRFGHKGHLNRHFRTHTAENPIVDESVGDIELHSIASRKVNQQSLKMYDLSAYPAYKR